MPLHVQLVISLIVGSFTFCLAMGIAGYLLGKRNSTLPPVPLFPGSNFPGVFAHFYTVFFLATFCMASVHGYMQQPKQVVVSPDLVDFVISAIFQTVLYLPFIILYLTLPARRNLPTGFLTKLKWIVLGLIAMLLPNQLIEMSGFNQWLVETTGCPPNQNVVELLRTGGPSIQIGMIIMAVIVAPLTEEFCFRGFLYNILKQHSGRIAAAVASSLLFSAVHTSVAQFIPLTLFALVQCYAYEKARSLWLPIVLHMLFNGLSALAILYIM